MKINHLDELKNLIQNHKEKGIRYGKSLDFLLKRIKRTKEDVEHDIFSLNNLEHIEKQEKSGETRFVLFFVHTKRKGIEYVLTFKDKIVIITAFPLGKRTLIRYRKKRFI
ncbi:MAG: hypothetical protein AABW56_04150 [Nanoarchaeota archaeon]